MKQLSAEKLNSIVARAASPDERRSSCFVPLESSSRTLELRLEAAIELSCGGDEPLFQELLKLRDLTSAEYERGLMNVRFADDGERPDWVIQLDCWFQDRALERKGEPFEPFLAEGRKVLAELTSTSVVGWGKEATEDVLRALAQRLRWLTSKDLESRLREAGVWTDSSMDWWSAFDLYPVFAQAVARVFLNWKFAVGLLAGRLENDFKLLQDAFGQQDLGELVHVHGADHGDTHHHGQKVLMLEFASGTEVVYKPRDLNIGVLYLNLEKAIQSDAPDLDFLSRIFLARDGYAWEEKLRPVPCQTPEEVERFFFRLGVMTRIFELLNSRDLHRENILAVGEYPVVIDLETVIHPHLGSENYHVDLTTMAFLTALHFDEIGCRPLDLGVLAGSREQRLPKRNQNLVFPPIPCLPKLGEQAVDSRDFHEPIESGYRRADDWLKKRGAAVLGEHLKRLPGTLFRSLYRSTDHYHRLLNLSLRPELLKHGWLRDAYLEKLYRAAVRWGHSPCIARNEIDGLRRLDFPTFTGRLDEDPLIGEDGEEAADFFSVGLSAEILQSLKQTTEDSSSEQLQTILALSVPTAHPRWKAGSGGRAKIDFSGELEQLAERLSRLARDKKRLSTNYVPWADRWVFGRMSPDLLGGTAGLALVCAELGIGLDSDECRKAVDSLVSELLEHLEESKEKYRKVRRSSQEKFFCGFHHGLGGELYALARCGRLLGRKDWVELAVEQMLDFPLGLALERCSSDYVMGTDGMALAMSEFIGQNPLLEARVKQVWENSEPLTSEVFPGESRTLENLPDLTAARVLLGHRLGHQRGLPGTRKALVQLELDAEGWPGLVESDDTLVQLKTWLRAHKRTGNSTYWRSAEELLPGLAGSRGFEEGRPMGWRVVPDHHLCGVTGLGAVALALLYLVHGSGPVCLDLPL